MDTEQKNAILEKAKIWFKDVVAVNHIKNTKKLINPNEFNINPFLTPYLANFLTGNATPESIAKALILPRILGSSITTSFGQNMQSFISVIRDAVGSTTSGMDIEFIDAVDGERKYCQLKAGPNTINKDDVETIAGHFRSVLSLSRTNNLKINNTNLVVGVLYGTQEELSGHYKRITSQYNYDVIVGQNFWYRLTGDENFYNELIHALASVATETNYSETLSNIIATLADTDEIKKISKM